MSVCMKSLQTRTCQSQLGWCLAGTAAQRLKSRDLTSAAAISPTLIRYSNRKIHAPLIRSRHTALCKCVLID